MTIGEIIFVVIWWLLLAGLIVVSISIRCDKKKKPKNKTDYPYLPLGMVTKHLGWSYEHVDKKGWRYVIWYKSPFSFSPDYDKPQKIDCMGKKCTREAVKKYCKWLEEYYFGPEDLTIYRKEELTKDDVIEPSDVTLEELLFNKERAMKNNMTTHKVKNVELIKEDGNYYLDITYELENDSRVEELHIPRAKIPFCGDIYPEIKVEDEFDDLFEYCKQPRFIPRNLKATLKTGFGNDLVVRRDENGFFYTIKNIKEKTQEMTLAEIEKKLGYKIKIISEDKKI